MSWLKSVFIVLIVIYQINCDDILACTEGVLRTTCTLTNLKFETKFNFSLLAGRYKYNLYFLNIKNSSLPYLPNGIFKDLMNVNTLSIVNCGVREISRSDFENGKKLRILDLSENSITQLDDGVFSAAVALERISLASNQIVQIDGNAFRSLNKLQRITLADNKIRDLASGVFSSVKTLSSLDLSRNSIESLSDGDLFFNLTFNDLNLSSNQLVTIGQQTLVNIKYVAQLNLSLNKIESMTLSGLSNIEQISVNNNQLTKLILNGNIKNIEADNNKISNEDLFAANDNDGSSVLQLSLKNNSLSRIGFVRNHNNLLYLDVSFNPIGDRIESDTFTKLARLKSLYMESVNLQELDYVLFAPLSNLEILDISYNNLATINFHSLSILEKLKQLYINGNNLVTITLDEFEYLFPNFNLIDFSDNNIQCNDLVGILKTLRPLNIRVYVDNHKLTANETNIRGIRCTNTTDLIVKQPVFIHSHDLSSGRELNVSQIALYLNQLQNANDVTQFQLNQILNNLNFNNLDNYAAQLNETKSQVDELKTQNKALAEKLDQVLSKFGDTTVPNDSPDTNQFFSRLDNLNKTLEDEIRTIKLEDGVNHDIKFIKVIMVLLFLVAVLFAVFKVVMAYVRHRPPYRSMPYNTMGVNLDENNL